MILGDTHTHGIVKRASANPMVSASWVTASSQPIGRKPHRQALPNPERLVGTCWLCGFNWWIDCRCPLISNFGTCLIVKTQTDFSTFYDILLCSNTTHWQNEICTSLACISQSWVKQMKKQKTLLMSCQVSISCATVALPEGQRNHKGGEGQVYLGWWLFSRITWVQSNEKETSFDLSYGMVSTTHIG